MPRIRAALLLAAAGACAPSPQAQTIWRCGDSYSPQPCAGGRPLAEAPPAADLARSQAAAATARDARAADQMEKERLRLEAQAPQAFVPPARSEPPTEKHKWPEQAGTRKLDVFTATAPGSKAGKAPKPKPKAKAKAGAGTDGKQATAKKAPRSVRPAGPAAARPARPST